MISLQENAFTFPTQLDQPIDGFARESTAVDIVAQKNMEWPACRVEGDIGINQGQELIEQVETTVDVADRINP